MSGQTVEKLAYMVNQIARNMAVLGEPRAIEATAHHIMEFWSRKMKDDFLSGFPVDPNTTTGRVAEKLNALDGNTIA